MKLFQQTQNWTKQSFFKRILLAYQEGMRENAFYIALQKGKLCEFDSLFCLDINRDAFAGLFGSGSRDIDSFIFQPSTWRELQQALQEVSEYINLKSQEGSLFSKTTIVINDWQSIHRLSAPWGSSSTSLEEDLLLQMKFLSDRANVILLNNSSYLANQNNVSLTSDNSADTLIEWSNLSFRLLDKYNLKVLRSLFNEWKVGQEINLINTNIQETPSEITKPLEEIIEELSNQVISVPNVAETEQSEVFAVEHELVDLAVAIEKPRSATYITLMTQLAEAHSRQELLIVRKEIQAQSNSLSVEEKVSLSDGYKVHLQRIKLLEDSFLGSN
jgi:hypothetical protein